jgi:hypothetical protein
MGLRRRAASFVLAVSVVGGVAAAYELPASAEISAAHSRASVHPGAFCAPGGAIGYTTTGLKMQCTTTATDSRNRWRRYSGK